MRNKLDDPLLTTKTASLLRADPEKAMQCEPGASIAQVDGLCSSLGSRAANEKRSDNKPRDMLIAANS